MTKSVLCYGDSLTWGWVPGPPGTLPQRYPSAVRWTGVLAEQLGDGYRVIEEGLSGRTTGVDDPLDPRLNGRTPFPAILASHLPLDLVVIMLGANDTKQYLDRSAFDIVTGAAALLTDVAASALGTAYPAPKVLLAAPPLLAGKLPDPWVARLFAGAREKLCDVRDGYRDLAAASGAGYFDAGTVIHEVGVDGVHLTEQNNTDLGHALAPVVRDMLAA